MSWLLDNLQIVIIVVIALGSWLSSRMESKKQEEEEVEDGDFYETEAPAPTRQPSVPPPLDRRLERQVLPPVRPAFIEERANEAEAMLKHQRSLEERLRQIRETKANTTGGAAATRLRAAAKNAPPKAPTLAPLTIRASLRKRSEIRRDMVMREILGPPVSLR
jgi:hypothetical protein